MHVVPLAPYNHHSSLTSCLYRCSATTTVVLPSITSGAGVANSTLTTVLSPTAGCYGPLAEVKAVREARRATEGTGLAGRETPLSLRRGLCRSGTRSCGWIWWLCSTGCWSGREGNPSLCPSWGPKCLRGRASTSMWVEEAIRFRGLTLHAYLHPPFLGGSFLHPGFLRLDALSM